MELWRELLISGLQNNSYEFDYINDTTIKEITQNECYKVLLQIKQILDNENLLDKDCYFKIEEIINTLDKNNVFLSRHDFG